GVPGVGRQFPRGAFVVLVGLLLLAAPPALQRAEARGASAPQQVRVIKVRILGMSCPFCARGASEKLQGLEGTKTVEVELEAGLATLTMKAGADVPNETLRKTLEDAGFEAAGIIRSFASDHEDWHPEKFPEEERFGPSPERAGARSES
ncbi:MAG: heavy-metal-associated domain-containing protein, partial [Gemmatimonadota bacterium]